MTTHFLPNLAATQKFALHFGQNLARFLQTMRANDTQQRCAIHLQGNLGTGKTTISQGILAGLGWQNAVRSPTYSLIETYQIPQANLPMVYHSDLYRLESETELEDLAWYDLWSESGIWLIEWAEKIPKIARACDIHITLLPDPQASDGRQLHLHSTPCFAALCQNNAYNTNINI